MDEDATQNSKIPIIRVPLLELAPWDKNMRDITIDDFKRLKKQIVKLGIYKPLLLSQDGKLLGGNMRVGAMQELSKLSPEKMAEYINENFDHESVKFIYQRIYPEMAETEMPLAADAMLGEKILEDIKNPYAAVVNTKNDSQALEYNLSDNDHAGYYDMDRLANELGEFDIDASLYSVDFDKPQTIEELLAGIAPAPEVQEDQAPEVDEQNPPVSKLGEVYQLGRHRLMCGDSTKIEDVEKLMDGQKADMVFTDPPYGIDEQTDRAYAARSRISEGGKFDKIIGDTSTETAISAYNLCETLNIPIMVFWGANYYCHSLPESGNWLVWDKRIEDKQRDFNSDCELAWVKSKKNSVRIFRHLWKGLIKGSEVGESRIHPTQKPIALGQFAFTEYGNENDNILDLFGGSGSTLIACEQLNRQCFMMELDPKYCDVIRKRYAKFVGKEDNWENTTPPIFDNLKEIPVQVLDTGSEI